MSDNTFGVQRFRALPTEIHVMLVGTLLTRGAYFMVWPFLALLLWREFRLSASAIGLLLALATVCGALSGIYTGWLSDRFGRKRLIFFGTSLSGLSFVLLGFSGQPLSYGLAISGVSIGCALLESSCKALIGDRVEDRRSRELALYCRYFLINLGAALGPLIGLTLGVAAQAGTFLVTALVYFCYGLLLWRLLHHLELKRRSLAPRSSTGFLEACLSMARHRAFTLLLLCNMLAALIYATFDSTLVQYLTRSGLPDVVNSIALLVTINALTIVVAQFPLLRLLENTGTGGRLMLGMLLMLLAQLGFAWTPVTLFAGLALATVVLSLGELIVFPTFSVEVDQLTPRRLARQLFRRGQSLQPRHRAGTAVRRDHARPCRQPGAVPRPGRAVRGDHAAAGRRGRPAPGRAGRRMSGALLVSGFFLRRSAWSVEGAGWRSCDHLRDAPGCDLAHWLDQAAATLAGEERVILCGHSFGGYLAQCLAARLGERAAHLYLFSALVSEGGGALESYQDSGQDNLLGLCRLDPLGGRVRLEDRAGFLELLGAEVPTSASEPAQLLIDSPRQVRPACPVTYVVAAADRLSPPPLQRTFAHRLDARVREYPGGHLAALADPRFLRALIESNN